MFDRLTYPPKRRRGQRNLAKAQCSTNLPQAESGRFEDFHSETSLGDGLAHNRDGCLSDTKDFH